MGLHAKFAPAWLVKLLGCGFVGVLCTLTATAQSIGIVTWQDNVPSGAAPFGSYEALAKVLTVQDNQMVFYPHPAQTVDLLTNKSAKAYANGQYITGALLVNAPISQVSTVIHDYLGYKKTYPTIVENKLLAQQGSSSLMHYRIYLDLPFPIPNLNEKVKLQHDITKVNNVNRMRTIIQDAPIKYGIGTFEWVAVGPNQTLIMLTQWADLSATKGILVTRLLQALPEVKSSIPYGVEAFVLESLRLKLAPTQNKRSFGWPEVIPSLSVTTINSLKTKTQPKISGQVGIVQVTHPVRILEANSVSFAKKTVSTSEPFRFVSSIISTSVSADKIRSTLLKPELFKGMFKQVKKVTVLSRTANSVTFKLGISVGLSFIQIPFDATLTIAASPNGDIVIQAVDGDVDWIAGRIQFLPASQGSTLVWTQNSHIGPHAPLLLQLGNNLPYKDYLPSVGAMPIIVDKMLGKLSN